MSNLMRVHVFVSGRVQGVGYRLNTERQARHLGVNGWVQNLMDGRVEAVFEGTESQIAAMIAWCRQGPLSAQVKDLDASSEQPEGLDQFEVRY